MGLALINSNDLIIPLKLDGHLKLLFILVKYK